MRQIDTGCLFTPIQLAGQTIPNRFVMPGMQRGWCIDGAPDERLEAYYRRRVEGGVGLIVSESVAVDHPSATQTDMFAWLAPNTLDAWSRCVGGVKEDGGHIILQLWHEGAIRKEGGDGPWSGHPTLSPSGLSHTNNANGRAARRDELLEIRDAFVRSAALAKRAGADGVEVHGAHGYLLDQFLWAVTNRRDDGYGGNDMRDRARLPAEIVKGIREECGDNFIISFRFSQWKEVDFEARIAEGPADLAVLMDTLKQAGVTVTHASTRRFWDPEWPDSNLNLAGWAKKLSGLPAITVGSIGLSTDVMSSLFGEEVEPRLEDGLQQLVDRFSAGEFDMAAVGRSLISDPDWIKKVRDGDFASIRAFARSDLGLPDIDMGIVSEAHEKS